MRAQLLNSILFGAWMIEESFAHSSLPMVQRMLMGLPDEILTEEQRQEAIARTLPFHVTSATIQHAATRKEDIQQGSVMVLPMKNAITKNDVFCGPRGTETMSAWVRAAEADTRVLGGVIDMDTPGGESMAMFQMVATLQSAQKPWVAITRFGKATSAGQGIAAACDEVHSTDPNDLFGSIGTMMTFLNMFEAMSAELKTKVQPLYATKSSAKNGAYMAAIKGDFGPLRAQLLDPMNERFIGMMNEMRSITDDGKVFAGQTYYAEEALSIGLIDKTGSSLEEAVARVEELASKRTVVAPKAAAAVVPAATTKPTVTNPSSHMFGFKKETKAIEALMTAKEGERTDEMLTAAQNELDAKGAGFMLVPQTDKIKSVAQLNAHLEALEARATKAEGELTKAQARVAELEIAPKSEKTATEPAAKKDPATPVNDDVDLDDLQHNKDSDAALSWKKPVAKKDEKK